MSNFNVIVEKRDDMGKGASRRLRRASLVPGIVYGIGQEPAAFQLPHTELEKHLSNEAFFSSVVTLTIDGKEESVVVKDMQRHPHKNKIMHLDFLRIDKTHKLTMNIPLHFINEDICIGVKQGGGVISHHMNELEVSCLASDLPEYIEIDLANLNLDEALHLSDLTMPEGVEIYALMHEGDATQPVASVHTPRIALEDEEIAGDAAVESDEDSDENAEDAGGDEE